MLKGYSLANEQYALAREGRQMFAIRTYENGHPDMGLAIGFRNSYDKSMAVGIAIGASVFVCDNLALSGQITVLRKHTANVWDDLEESVVTTLYRSQHNFSRICTDAEVLKTRQLEDDEAFALMGKMFGRNILTPRQMPQVKREWLRPTYEDFEPRTAWSFYNACTETLKTAPPLQVMEKHIKLHNLLLPEGTA